ncbi:MAG: glutamyl-tRNA amidotransferase [Nitrosospira sp. 56-18]|nr:GatB/YqeY domain-containing protein [Nitrosospira sp.]OJY14720.1 MAG: glutamyl-tRNA amidotransferase [Nitrosospira sp. 56-18]
MNLRQQITEDMKSAMRAGDARRRDAIRLLQAALKQREVDERIELDDAAVVAVVEKMLKQRRDSIAQYEAAHRQDLADAEKFEVSVLQDYMPSALSEIEIEAAITEAVSTAGAKGQQDMGKVMALLKPRLSGRADMGKVSALLRARLAG